MLRLVAEQALNGMLCAASAPIHTKRHPPCLNSRNITYLFADARRRMEAPAAILVSAFSGAQLGAQSAQVGMFYLLGLALLVVNGCYRCRQVLILI